MRESLDPAPAARRQTSMQSLLHAFTILEAIGAEGREMGVMELSRQLGMPRSTVHRVLATLRERRYLEQDGPAGKYRLGLKLWELGCGYRAHLELCRLARPYMEWLTLHCLESSHLAVYDRGHAVYVDVVECDRPVRAFVHPGGRFPAHCTATGKVLLAHQPDEVVDEVVSNGLAACTSRTINDPHRLRQELAGIRQRGYATSCGEYREELAGVAAAVWGRAGEPMAALEVGGPAVRFNFERIIDLVCQASARVSASLRYPQSRPLGR